MDYNLRTKKDKDITNVTDTYYDFSQHIYKHFGHESIRKIIDKTRVKYHNIWYKNEDKTKFLGSYQHGTRNTKRAIINQRY